MQWTARMAQVEACCAGRDKPSWKELGLELGVSRERARQLHAKLQRWKKTHRLPAKVHEDRLKARYLLHVLGGIERVARACARQHALQPKIDRIMHGYKVGEDRAWTIYRLEQLHIRQLADERRVAWQRERERQWRVIYKPRTQEELRELAKHAHWADVIWESGTDRIVAVRRKTGW